MRGSFAYVPLPSRDRGPAATLLTCLHIVNVVNVAVVLATVQHEPGNATRSNNMHRKESLEVTRGRGGVGVCAGNW